MKHSIILFTASIAVFVTVVVSGAFAVLHCESSAPTANIKTIQDALWWSLNVSSVGDACFSPVTTPGRVIGAILIIIGYACFTVNVGTISAVISHKIHNINNKKEQQS